MQCGRLCAGTPPPANHWSHPSRGSHKSHPLPQTSSFPNKFIPAYSFPSMKVVILCGGRGTRLREETEFRPKPMLPIGNRPILWHIMNTYAHHGHKDFILCLGYKGDMIRDYFRNYHWNTCDATLRLGQESAAQFHTRHEEEDWTVTL